MAHSYMNGMYDFAPVRRQLDEMTRRRDESLPPPSSQRQSSLPPVPELPTPTTDAVPLRQRQLSAPTTYPVPYDTTTTLYSNGQMPMQMPAPIPTALPASMAPMVHQGSPRPHSTVGGPTVMSPPMPPAAMPPRPMSMPPNGTSGSPVQFEPVCRYEDTQAIRAVAFHPTGLFRTKSVIQKFCCPGPSNTAGAEMEFSFHDGTIRDVVFLEDSVNRTSLLVSGGAGNCQLHVTDCHTGQLIQSLRGHSAPILGLFTWNSGPLFVSCSQDKTIRFWDVRSSQAVNVIQPTSKTHSKGTKLQCLGAPVTSVCVDPSGQLLVSGHEDASVALYDITGGRILQTYRPHGDEVRTVRFSNAAYYLLSASYDKRMVITDMRGDLMAPLTYLPVAEHSDKVIQCRHA
ncbi:WD domain, G-beta repeat protein [Ancylostoma duodenale]|uniref:WD domain, G-beta repeat protein n=1 Tax=Ancylostoma duodenale TaxID=51022 RepID=A0A0C2CFH8_9BILA|nr:WD domain, G-beta repeat protein [Ancylostoma duodenale]